MSSDDNNKAEMVDELHRLMQSEVLSENDSNLAQQCLRRLTQPLRLTVFGTDPKQAMGLLNLMAGHQILPTAVRRARVQVVHSETTQGLLEMRDGTRRRLTPEDFETAFDDDPARVRIGLDLPVLKKVSFMVVADDQPAAICEEASALRSSDIALWTGFSLTEGMKLVWSGCTEWLRDHSYLALSPLNDVEDWSAIQDEFVETLIIDPRLALHAKAGGNTEAFKQAGGASLVKTIKKEIDVLSRAATDAAAVLLARYKADSPENSEEADQSEPTEDLSEYGNHYRLRRESRASFMTSTTRDAVPSQPNKKVGRRGSRIPGKATPWSLGI